jgi:hypothetical protein
MGVSDMDGRGTLHLELYSVNYIFQILNSTGSTIFSSTTSMTIPSSNIYFKSQDTSNIIDFGIMETIDNSLDWDNATSSFVFTWDDTLDRVTSANLTIYQLTTDDQTKVCEQEALTSSGSLSCDLTAYASDTESTFRAIANLKINSSSYVAGIYDQVFAPAAEYWGKSGLFLSLMIIIILACMGLWNPSAALVFAGIGVVISTWFGLFPLPALWLAGILALIAIAVWRMKT